MLGNPSAGKKSNLSTTGQKSTKRQNNPMEREEMKPRTPNTNSGFWRSNLNFSHC